MQKLNDEAMQLERSPGDAETARSLRRTVHTLKGDSAACGFRELSELAHEFEDVLTAGNTGLAAACSADCAARGRRIRGDCSKPTDREQKLPAIQALRQEIARLAHPKIEPEQPARKARKKAALKTDALVGI